MKLDIAGIAKFFADERRHYVAYSGLSVGFIALAGLGYLHNRLLFRRFLGAMNPIVAVGTVAILGTLLLTALLVRWHFTIFARENLKGFFARSLFAFLLAAIAIFVDSRAP
jgi:asparagine N-glycosylation enzyme membrane subunit Stt3